MTRSPITYARVRAELDYPIEIIWARIAAFGGLDRWADGVSACSVEGEGTGAVRTVVRDGRSVRERLEAIDSTSHTLRYKILPPHILPADEVHGNIELGALEEGSTDFLWRSDAVDFRIPAETLGAAIERFYSASIEGLRRLLDANGKA